MPVRSLFTGAGFPDLAARWRGRRRPEDLQQEAEHHHEVSRQVDDGGVEEEGEDDGEDDVDDVALHGVQEGQGGEERVVEVAVADVVRHLFQH